MNKPVDNESAVTAFITRREEAIRLLSAITDRVEDHLGTNPDTMNWGHAGDMGRIVAALRELAEVVGLAE